LFEHALVNYAMPVVSEQFQYQQQCV